MPMRPLHGYPTSFGNKRASVFPKAGPTSYTVVTIASPADAPVTGGQTLEAVEAGMKFLDFVIGGTTDSGLYRVEAIPVTVSDNPNGAATETWVLRWRLASSNAEVGGGTNLSDEVVRLMAYGPS